MLSTVTSVETFVSGAVCVVRVRTDDGLEGIGQAAPGQAGVCAEVLHSLVAPHFLGRDAWDLGSLVDKCLRAEYKFLGTFLCRALSGVDTALWDLQGKAIGKPVYQLLGGRYRDRVPMYASSMSRETSAQEEVARVARAVEVNGLRCAKIKIGDRVGRDGEPFLSGRTAELIPLMRKTLGDTIEISADANGAYSPGQAVRVGRLLEEYGYYHLEEPNPAWELDNMGYVAGVLDIPIGAGEQEFSLEIIRRMVAERLVDVIQPDICYIGGLTRARRVAELAELAGIPCTPHSSGHSMIQVFTAHFVTAMPACTQFQEWSIENQDRVSDVYAPVLALRDGYLEVSDAPGWGVDILPSFLQRAQRRVSTVE